jgi:2-keto-4-pentenoate hydratase/2-oxohepta-3-ene-1,7-dioic acid hydratase in catechol pathway
MSFGLLNAKGRAGIQFGNRFLDVERASGGRFSSDPMLVIQGWDGVRDWAGGLNESAADSPVNEADLGPPIPRPTKVFGVGLNYRSHATEAGLEAPKAPLIFTKFPSCLVGPRADVRLSSAYVDWEVELVVVMGRRGRRIPEAKAFDHVAGYCVGQDISDRKIQFADKPPQFSMGKSIDTYGPIGPAMVTIDAIPHRNDLALSCEVAGEKMQDARTTDMIFSVAELVAYLSKMCTLEPGDLIFTGTPSGVGSTRDPRRYLREEDVIVSTIEHVGTMTNRCIAGGL